MAQGNPKHIGGIDWCKGITNHREPGAGSRILLDRALQRLGIVARWLGMTSWRMAICPRRARPQRRRRLLRGHAHRGARHLFGLFIPLASERYDLVMRKRQLSLPAIQQLLDTEPVGLPPRVGRVRRLRCLPGRHPVELISRTLTTFPAGFYH